MDTSFTETLAANDRQEEEKVEIWSVHGSVGFGEEKQREREDESFKTEGGSFIPAPCSSKERGLGICLTGQRTGRSKLKDEYKEEVMAGRCGNIVSCGIRDGPLKTSRLSVKKRGKEAGGKWRSGRGSVC